LWFRRGPNDNEGLPEDLKPFFTTLCDIHMIHYWPGRLLLAAPLGCAVPGGSSMGIRLPAASLRMATTI
jgi:hypothetical protein